jgi:hypothetical protein
LLAVLPVGLERLADCQTNHLSGCCLLNCCRLLLLNHKIQKLYCRLLLLCCLRYCCLASASAVAVADAVGPAAADADGLADAEAVGLADATADEVGSGPASAVTLPVEQLRRHNNRIMTALIMMTTVRILTVLFVFFMRRPPSLLKFKCGYFTANFLVLNKLVSLYCYLL